ncbi:MAG: hypothetical protein IKN15_02160 [Bacteroidaceae bacterium]|nr:hypothetical protein [Bacteroidaceae bacterium]
MGVESALPSMIVGGNVIGYSDHNENLYKERDVIGEFNRRAINAPGYGYNDILATIEKFKQNHSYEFQPLTEQDYNELDTTSVSTPAGTLTKTSISTPSGTNTSVSTAPPEPMDADVAQAMSLLKDCILQG